MKKLRGFWALCVFLFLLAGCNSDIPDTINETQGESIVCLGDSLTAGYGASTPGEDDKSKSYPAYLQEKVNIPVFNAGVSGDTTAQGLARVDSEVLSHNPQIVIILLGANDLRALTPLQTTIDNLQRIIDKVNDGKRKIYFAKFYGEITEEKIIDLSNLLGITNYAVLTELITQIDNAYNTLASENDVTLIEDIWQGIWGIHMSDLFHPDAAGYEIMADNIFNVLQPYLQENDLLK